MRSACLPFICVIEFVNNNIKRVIHYVTLTPSRCDIINIMLCSSSLLNNCTSITMKKNVKCIKITNTHRLYNGCITAAAFQH